MANNFLLDPEKQKQLERFLNPNQLEDPRYDPSTLGEFLPDIPDLSGLIPSFGRDPLLANQEMKLLNNNFFGPKSPKEISNQPSPASIPSISKIAPSSLPSQIKEPVMVEESPIQKLLSEYQKLYSPSQLQSDADLMNQALDKKRDLSLLDMMMKGGAQMAGGLAQTKPAEMIQTAPLADIDIQKAKEKAGLSDRQAKAIEAQMKITDMKEMSDPNSPTSKIYRQTLKEMAPNIAAMPELVDASANMIKGVYPMVKEKLDLDARRAQQQIMLQFRQEQLGQRQKEEKRRTQQGHLNAARGLLKDDPRFKKAIEQGMEFESVNDLLSEVEKGNEVALSALGTKLARAMGEVGVLTDTDVVRYIAGQSWGRRLEKWYKGGMQGKLPPESLKEIRKNLKLLRGKLSGDVDKVYNNAGSRMKSAFPELDDTSIKGLLGQPMITPSESKQEIPSWDQFEDIE